MYDRRAGTDKLTNRQTDKLIGDAAGGTYSFRRLDVWDRSQKLATDIIKLVRALPRDASRDVIIRQVVACAASVGANIAEGHARFSYAAYRNHLNIARGSAAEVGSWLDLLKRTGDISEEDEKRLGAEADSIAGLLRHKIRQLTQAEAATRPPRAREDRGHYITSSDMPADDSTFLDDSDLTAQDE